MNSNGIKIPVKTDAGIKLCHTKKEQDLIADSKTEFKGLCHYILATRKNGEWNTDFEPELMRDLLKEKQVTVIEAIQAFRKAYSDPYTPATGIEWRHLWKHIEEIRMGADRRFYTYQEMLNIVDKENITTDHFEFVGKDKFKRK